MDQADFLREMQLLRQEYASGLEQRLEEIKDIFCQLDINRSAGLLQELFRLVHSLSGSAATFGYARVNTQARLLELMLQEVIRQKSTMGIDQRQMFAQTMEMLEKLRHEGPDSKLIEQLPSGIFQVKSDNAHKMSLYLVEDDEVAGREIQSQLMYMGFDVQLFADASLAHQAILEKKPDVILMDIMLPEGQLAGTELAAVVQEIHDDQVPVFFISVRGDWEARLAAVRAGGRAYLTKPIDYMQLLAQLDRVARRSGVEPFRILIVDDAVELARHYALILQNSGMQVEILHQPETVLDVIINFKPELIVLDLYMPGVSGFEVANVIRQHQDLIGIPIVFLSSEQDLNIQFHVLREGDDFLQKPVSDHHFVAAITSRAERARLLGTLMCRDGLTGLLNHSTLKIRLQDEIHRARRLKSNLCFIMIDLDRFKVVNDLYGHPVGDRVLKCLSRLLTDRLRKTDQTGRYGAEEFGVIFPDTQISSALELIEEIRTRFAGLVFTEGDQDFHCTFSAGIAQLMADDDAGSLSKRADKMLYIAKQHGHNRVVVRDDLGES